MTEFVEAVRRGRAAAASIGAHSVLDLIGHGGISEGSIHRLWSTRLSEHGAFEAEGWYMPPPAGVAVLLAPVADPGRLAFVSLRDPSSWPQDLEVPVHDLLMYLYASPVDRRTLAPCDVAATLYFGSDPAIGLLFDRAEAAVAEVLELAFTAGSSRALFERSTRVFAEHGLENMVVSRTDAVPCDLGHTLPNVMTDSGDAQAAPTAEMISKGRRFVNDVDDFELDGAGLLTIEPQLVDFRADRSRSPGFKLSFHYVVDIEAREVLSECRRFGAILREAGLRVRG